MTFLYRQNEYIRHYRTNSPLHHDIVLISELYIQGLKIVLYQSMISSDIVTPALHNTNAGCTYRPCRMEGAILAQYWRTQQDNMYMQIWLFPQLRGYVTLKIAYKRESNDKTHYINKTGGGGYDIFILVYYWGRWPEP